MTLELLFGNQNIKEDRISQMKSVSGFLDQELSFQFRPMTCMFRKEYMAIIQEFFEMDIEIDSKTKLMAQEEYEKLREALSLQNMFEAQSQI